jgi:hypothetical protein
MKANRSVLILRVCGWVALPLLLVGTALRLIEYAGWSAVTSAYHGLPKEAEVVSRASHAATAWLFGLIGLGLMTTGLTLVLLPFPFERLSPGLRGSIRIVLALIIVVAGTAAVGDLLVIIGHCMH